MDKASNWRCTPLMAATKGDYLEVVHALFNAKEGVSPSLDVVDNEGYNAMHRACIEKAKRVTAFLVSKSPESLNSVSPSTGDTPLMTAIKKADPFVPFLLDLGPDVTVYNLDGHHAL